MKKILILANNDIGLYKFRKELIQDLLSKGYKIYISLPYGDLVMPLINMGCEFIETPIDRRGINIFSDLKTILNYFKVIDEIKPDLVMTYTIKPNIYGGIISRFKKIPYAINITGLGTAFQKQGVLKILVTFLYKLASSKARVLFFENKDNQITFINNKIVSKKNTCLLNGAGVNLNEYSFLQLPKNNDIHFLFIGRVMKEKGIEELFEAAKRIKREFNNVVFDIVGQLEDDYEDVIYNLESESIIIYHGFQLDIKPYIQNAHCFILPSYHEGMANTLLENAAMGRPLITSNIHGCKETVIQNKSGYLVKTKDCEDLYMKIKDFIQLPYQQKVKMGIESREHIEKHFNKEDIIKKTVNHLF